MMRIPGELKSALNDILHFKAPVSATIPERAVKEQQALHDLGQSEMFAALLDQFEAMIRAQFRVFVDTNDEEVAVKTWREARAAQALIKRTMDAVQAKQRGEELEALAVRQMDAMKADRERFHIAVERAKSGGSSFQS